MRTKSFFSGLALMITGLIICCGCKHSHVTDNLDNMKMKDSFAIDKIMLDSLALKKIFFGHQSVGKNIVDGISIINTDNLDGLLSIVQLNVKEGTISGPAFYHANVGRNKYPESKISAFEECLSTITDTFDFAFLKFCYIDFQKNTNPEEVFNLYRDAMERLSKTYPNTRFLHMTVPLKVKNKGLKGFIDQIRGKELNHLRCAYNDMLIKEFGKENVFDLAYYESTYPSGKRLSHGRNTYSLIPEYTDDGAHLNSTGKEYIAKHLLYFLSKQNSF